MPAVVDLEQLCLRCLSGDAADLVERAVLVVHALDREHGAADGRQLFFDIPLAEGRMQPDAAPAPEGRVGVVVVAAQPGRKVGFKIRPASDLDVCHGDVFHKDMRRHQDEPGQRIRKSGGVQQRDGAAVAVPEQPGFVVDIHRGEKRRQDLISLPVHEIHIPQFIVGTRRGATVAGSREHQPAKPAGLAELRRKVFPHRDRTQALVQKDHQRRVGPICVKALVLDLHIAIPPSDSSKTGVPHHPCRSRSRSRKRWILPVAVLGSSSTNSTKRGYL